MPSENNWRKLLAMEQIQKLISVGCFIDDLTDEGVLPEADRIHMIEKLNSVRVCIQDACIE
jgi:hypothetical protein